MDWKLVEDSLMTGATVVIALFTYRAAVQARKTVQEATRTTTKHEHSLRKIATIRQLHSCKNDYLNLPEKIKSCKEKLASAKLSAKLEELQRLEERLTAGLMRLFTVWEHLAAGINAGVYDIEVFNQMTGSRCLSQYKEHARFVRTRRREESLRIYDQLDTTIDRLLEIHSDKHLITDKTLRLLKANYVDPDIIRRLKGLKGVLYNNYKELSAVLVDQGLEREKNLIFSFSRYRCCSIVRCDKEHQEEVKEHQEQVIDLFVSVQNSIFKKYKLIWPPNVPTGDRDALRSLLFHKANDISNYIVLYNEPSNDQPPWWRRPGLPKAQVVGFVALQDLAKEEDTHHWNQPLGPNWKDKAFSTDKARRGREVKDLVVIRRFVVHPSFCRMGIGRMLLRHAIRTIQELDAVPNPNNKDRGGKKRERPAVPLAVIPVQLEDAIDLCEREGGLPIIEEYQDHLEGKVRLFVF